MEPVSAEIRDLVLQLVRETVAERTASLEKVREMQDKMIKAQADALVLIRHKNAHLEAWRDLALARSK